jgi:transforming growth factor-beta-induced protein
VSEKVFARALESDSQKAKSFPENKMRICESDFHFLANPIVQSRSTTASDRGTPNQNYYKMKPLFKSLACIVSLALSAATLSAADEKKDIVDTAVAAGSFKTLAAALGAAELVDALKGEGPFTVFAPTDEAFAKLPEGTVESLLKPENKAKLVDILTYHVVAGKVPSATAVTLKEATALNKKVIALEVKDGALFLNESKVVTADVEASNGVIHIIDSVLLPPADKE